jgi:hypothetical protein
MRWDDFRTCGGVDCGGDLESAEDRKCDVLRRSQGTDQDSSLLVFRDEEMRCKFGG